MATPDILIPVTGCWVRQPSKSKQLGRVLGHRSGVSEIEIEVNWGSNTIEWTPLSRLRCGFQSHWAVQDVPLSSTRRPLGLGRIVGYRELGEREQLLVQLDNHGRSVWLPYENLRRIKDVRMLYERAETNIEDHGERFRLRLLAHALENWNHSTGSLDRLDVDPLPHQIQLVHSILISGNYNWLIADAVGLGKTIEVGLLLNALKRKGQARRVLVVCPAGLTRQWQDELLYKFDRKFEIYGRDIRVYRPEHWKLHDHVIVSMDLAKGHEHLQNIRRAGTWDIVIFDEGHKLTRYGSGERTQRYRLAEALRLNTDSFVLLSGTPHQGYTDRFIAILELVRPDLRQQIQMLVANPDLVSEMIIRNRKSEVIDADGNFIFKGQQVHRVAIEPSEMTRRFQRLLNDYLRRGYRAGESAGTAGRAIGFVMTTYQKLPSSSIAAIEHALHRRLERLMGTAVSQTEMSRTESISIADLSEGGDDQDDLDEMIYATPVGEFFDFERDMIDGLLEHAVEVRRDDEKLEMFLNRVVEPLINQGKKLLVFTEYRATQSYLLEALEANFQNAGEAVIINGSMSLDDKLEAISAFNENARFMISTEAGGEGINLHQSCHVMVNYDLPWNPARLVQRVGRLYRYGQTEPVIVFNLHTRDTFDNAAIDLMLQKVAQIVRDMAHVGEEFDERLHAEIVGDLLENIDLASVLQSSTELQIERTRDQIDEAFDRAMRAKELQDEIFSYVEERWVLRCRI